MEEIAEPQSASVVICGFGRYGQIVGRALVPQGVSVTVLDHDPDTIESLRQIGFRVFYGDATRLDLLRIAGVAQARAVVVAVDDVDQSLEIVDLMRENFPNVPVVARARNVGHLFQLRDRGVKHIEREVFESSLRSARSVLEELGWPAAEAREATMAFRRANLQLTDEMYPAYQDRNKMIATAKEGRRQFEEQMTREREQRRAQRQVTFGWDGETAPDMTPAPAPSNPSASVTSRPSGNPPTPDDSRT